MSLSVAVPAELETSLRRRAAAEGKEIADLVREALEEKLRSPQTFSEILAPVHQAFAEAGFDEAQATRTFEQLRNEGWESKTSKDRPS